MRKLEGNDVLRLRRHVLRQVPAISNAIVEEKAAAIERTGADFLLAGELGCLMNMAASSPPRRPCALPTVEVLAGLGDGPAIGEEG